MLIDSVPIAHFKGSKTKTRTKPEEQQHFKRFHWFIELSKEFEKNWLLLTPSVVVHPADEDGDGNDCIVKSFTSKGFSHCAKKGEHEPAIPRSICIHREDPELYEIIASGMPPPAPPRSP